MQVVNDEMRPADLHFAKDLKQAIGCDHVQEEEWILRGRYVQNEDHILGSHDNPYAICV